MRQGKFTCNAGGLTLRWTSFPPRGKKEYYASLRATETKISSALMGYAQPYAPTGAKRNDDEDDDDDDDGLCRLYLHQASYLCCDMH